MTDQPSALLRSASLSALFHEKVPVTNRLKGVKPMYSILLVIEKGSQEPFGTDKYSRTISAVSSVLRTEKPDTGIQRLAENVLLIPLGSALDIPGKVLSCLRGPAYKYAVLRTEDIVWRELPEEP